MRTDIEANKRCVYLFTSKLGAIYCHRVSTHLPCIKHYDFQRTAYAGATTILGIVMLTQIQTTARTKRFTAPRETEPCSKFLR